MAKKSFKSEAEDIFGNYNEPSKTTKKEIKTTIKKTNSYKPYLLAIETHQLEQLKALAWHQQKELKDILQEMMNEYFSNIPEMDSIQVSYNKNLKK